MIEFTLFVYQLQRRVVYVYSENSDPMQLALLMQTAYFQQPNARKTAVMSICSRRLSLPGICICR